MTARIPKQVSRVIYERDHEFVTSTDEKVVGTSVSVHLPNSKKVTSASAENVSTCENTPFDVTLLGLERINYSSKYNSHHNFIGIDNERRFVYIDEGEIAYAATQGIMPGGRTMTQFVWATTDASGLTLVAVGSPQHEKLVNLTREFERDEEARRQRAVSGESPYRVGHVYKKKGEYEEYMYLGSVKEPGIESAYHAFMRVPTCPLYLPPQEVERSRYIESYRVAGQGKSLEYALQWDNLTIVEQYAFASRIHPELERLRKQAACGRQIPVGSYENYADIVLYASQPKFEELERFHDSHIHLVNEVRLNSCGKHRYVNGHGEDKAEIAYARQQNIGLRYKPSPYNTCNYEAEIRKYNAAVLEWRVKYAAELQWSTVQS